MRKFVTMSLVAAAAWTIPGQAEAQTRDPMVIQGLGPESAPTVAHRAAPRQRYASSSRGQYGGGFIELLMTGSAGPDVRPAPAPVQRRPAWRPQEYRSHIPASAAPAQRTVRQASIDQVPDFRRGLSSVLDPKYERQEVAYSAKHGAGTIVVDTPNRFLYLVLGNGRAMRYGIGVGRPGFEWSGVKRVTRKAEWPDWRPPSEMLKRRPDLPAFMPGGPSNPLGARAMYLGSSLYRIHGTNEPETIGTNVSSGCIRLLNRHVIDLYGRVRVGTKVIVI
ncbi:MAG: L,D-transpeptidase family protein [Beijerinckiaceae bacterium]